MMIRFPIQNKRRSKVKRVVGCGVLLYLSAVGFAHADNFSADQKKAIQSIVHDYIVNQPEVLIEASQSLQHKQQQKLQAEAKVLINKHAKEVFTAGETTVGNPKGSVTLVEFFDYQCGHCKQMAPVLLSVMEKNPNLRVIYKEFPIFGEQSLMISKAALAAGMQKQYAQMHDALLMSKKSLNEDEIMKVAESLKLDMKKFKTDLQSKEVQKTIDETRKLGELIHLMGTPAFIIAATPGGVYKEDNSKPVAFIPGAASEGSLLEIVKNAG